jgi:hypothetical protein
VLAIRVPVSPYFHPNVVLSMFGADTLEPVVLTGDFGVAAAPATGDTLLTPPPTALRLGSWTDQGLPDYTGALTYGQTIDLPEAGAIEAWLDCGDVQVTAAAKVNGHEVGRRCWPPYQFSVDRFLVKGANTFEITVTNSLGNLLNTAGWTGYLGSVLAEPRAGLAGPVFLAIRPRA